MKVVDVSISALHSKLKSVDADTRGTLIMIIEKEDADDDLAAATLNYELTVARTVIDKAEQNFDKIIVVIIPCNVTQPSHSSSRWPQGAKLQ